MIVQTRSRKIDYKSALLELLRYVLMIGQFVLPCVVLFFGYFEHQISWFLIGFAFSLWIILLLLFLRVGSIAKRQRISFRTQLIAREQAIEQAERDKIEKSLPTSERKCLRCKYFFSKSRMPDAITNVSDTCELHLTVTEEGSHCSDWIAAL